MNELEITTDGKWKNFVFGHDVPKKVLSSRFDYLKDGEDSDGFFKYKGTWHHTSEFMRFRGDGDWDGILNFGFTNGLLLKISNDGEQYKVAYYVVRE